MSMSEISEWLEGLDLGKYASRFEDNEITLSILADLTDGDLAEIGLPLGPRRLVQKAARDLSIAPPEAGPSPSVLDAERRQITVMFCDLVGSTALAETLDPEDLRGLMQAYQMACGAVIEKYEGHVAQYLGDGLMIYFGWPRAHEDDATRAVLAALGITEAVKSVAAPSPLQVRIGIATGPVVVGETARGDAAIPKLAVGDAPNLASRLEGLAGPDQTVISPATHRLVGGAVECQDLGTHTLRGILDPVRAWRVIGEGAAGGRFEAAHTGPLSAIVGRETEVALLMDRWELSREGEGQVVMLGGEPGIGKSRIVQAVMDRVDDEEHIRLRYQCSPYHTNSALYPVIQQLERASGIVRDDDDDAKLDKLQTVLALGTNQVGRAVAMLAPLLSIDPGDKFARSGMSPRKQIAETIEVLADQLSGLSETRPVLLILEDAHWIDPSTQEAFDRLAAQVARRRVLLIITHRLEYQPPWSSLGHATALRLSRLRRSDVTAMATQVTGGKSLPEQLLGQIIAKTDGIPLFVEELTAMVIESGLVEDTGGRFELSGPITDLAVPSTLQDSLTARLDRMAAVREVAQIGACIGRTFPQTLLAAVADMPEDQLDSALQKLEESELLFRNGRAPNARYTFKHALVQDAAHDLLLRSRRQEIHRRIAEALESDKSTIVEKEPEVVAQHYAEAELHNRAIDYWIRAGGRALRRYAYAEAVEHLTTGLAALERIPEGEDRDRLEIALRAPLGAAYIQSRGFGGSEVEITYTRTLELCDLLDDDRRRFDALFGLCVWYLVRGEVRRSGLIAGRILALAESSENPTLTLVANLIYGVQLVFVGDCGRARDRLSKVLEVDDRIDINRVTYVGGGDPIAYAHLWLSFIVWKLGYPDTGIAHLRKALVRADEVDNPASRAGAMTVGALTLLECGELDEAIDLALEGSNFAKEQGLPDWEAVGLGASANAKLRKGLVDEALSIMEYSDEMRRVIGMGFRNTRLYRARAHMLRGELDKALEIFDITLPEIRQTGELWFESELLRMKGDTLVESGADRHAEAEACFVEARQVAQRQKTKAYELRAVVALGRLWQSQGKAAEAHALVAEVYDWFEEGQGTVDLQAAKALLDDLAQNV
jgi:class 3 adenylate cyclase/tetratricopeptide (TPR) repeat protein